MAKFLRDHREELVLFPLFLVLYLLSGFERAGERDLREIALGADPPMYLQFLDDPPDPGRYMIFRHPLTATACLTFNDLTRPWRAALPEWLIFKLPFALAGAFAVLAALGVFRRVVGRHALLCTLAFGAAAVVWFFAATPESGIYTTLATALYLLFNVKYRDRLTPGRITVLSALLMVGMMNEVSFVTALVVPLIVHGGTLLRDRRLLANAVLQTAAAGLLVYVQMAAFCYSLNGSNPAAYWQEQFEKYHERAYRYVGNGDTVGELAGIAALNVFFFNHAFPDDHTSQTYLQYGSYAGYFPPTLRAYLDHPATAVFLALHLLALAAGALRLLTSWDRVAAAFVVYALLRAGLILRANPAESLVFAGILVLPVLAVAFRGLVRLPFARPALVLLVVSMFVSNGRFFLALHRTAAPAEAAGEVVLAPGWHLEALTLTLEPVHSRRTGDDQLRLTLTRDGGGAFAFDAGELPPTTYAATVGEAAHTQLLDVERGGTDDARLEVPAPTDVLVRVVDRETGAPIERAQVTGCSANDIFGRVRLKGAWLEERQAFLVTLAGGRVSLHASAPGHEPGSEIGVVAPGGTFEVTVALERR